MQNEKVTKRVGSLIKIKPEFEERYIILHKHTFPGVLSQIRKVNIKNYSIFHLEGLLFSYFEYIGNNFDRDMKMIADETTKEWWKLTDPMQEPLATRKEGEWWAAAEQLSLISENVKPHSKAQRYAYVVEIKPKPIEIEIVKKLLLSMEKLFTPLFKKYHFQNQNIFFKDNKIYVYLEYVGTNFSKDNLTFNKLSIVKRWVNEFNKNLITEWKEMKEVFYTD
jgi:L-rhamnose mutarotase